MDNAELKMVRSPDLKAAQTHMATTTGAPFVAPPSEGLTGLYNEPLLWEGKVKLSRWLQRMGAQELREGDGLEAHQV